jgi:DNA helicase HerA-like ATPase
MNIFVGHDFITGKPFYVDTSKHINIEGSSGMGKSTLLLNIFSGHIKAGFPAGLVDPHGDLADAAVPLIPLSRIWDFIWLDPNASSVPPLNPLYAKTPEELELQKESLTTIIKSQAGTAWGDESARVSINAIDAICEYFKKPSPVHAFRFMADDKFRKKILDKTANPLLKMFHEQYDEKLRESDQMAKFSPPMNKYGKLLRPTILPIIGHAKSLDFLDLMRSRIFIARLSKGRLGEEIAQIIGSLIVSMFSIAALKRERQRNRPPFMLMIDETHNFTHGGRFSSILAEGRKYGISLVSGTQGMYQLPFAQDLLANCPTQIIFNASGEDAHMISRNWGQDVTAQITSLSRYQFMVRSFEHDQPIVRTITSALPLKPGTEARTNKMISHSLERWSIPRKDTNEKIMKFLSA